jgi:hypothetical protein
MAGTRQDKPGHDGFRATQVRPLLPKTETSDIYFVMENPNLRLTDQENPKRLKGNAIEARALLHNLVAIY